VGLKYKDEDNDGNFESNATQRDRLTIPLIGPIPRSSPLIVGAEMRLNQPTPLQWRSLEESVITHMERNKSNDSTSIDGAPIVAIIDEITGKEQEGTGKMTGRYATLAAVIGITAQNIVDNYDPDESFTKSVFDIKDAETFLGGSVRFVGIGRAVLGKVYYQVPSKIEDDLDEEDHEDDYDEMTMPIIMAEFKVLHDTGVRADEEWNVGKRSRQVSPVAAINNLNSAANRAEWVHSERRKLISGMTAGKARLTNFNLRQTEDLEDYDGLGMLAGFDDIECDTEACEDTSMTTSDIFSALEDDIVRNSAQIVPESESTASEILSKKINYGLSYASGFSTLADLTREALEVLDPYYSPPFKEREEYWYEIYGFVAWRALEGFVEPEDVAWALKCKSSTERLERAVLLLMEHRTLLQKLASEVSQELKECGEECTDLW